MLSKVHCALWTMGLIAAHVWLSSQKTVLHGDLLYFEAFFRDVIVRGRPFSGFQFTEATFLFPDLLTFVALRSLVPDIISALLSYAFVLSSALALLLYLLFRKVWGNEKSEWNYLLGLLTFFGLSASTPTFSHQDYWPDHHGAILLLFLSFLLLLLDLPQASPPKHFRALVLGLVLSFAYSFSDLLSVPIAILPAVALAGRLALKKEWELRSALRFSAMLALGIGFGYVTLWLMVQLHGLKALPIAVSHKDLPDISLSARELPRNIVKLFQRDGFLWSSCLLLGLLAQFAGWNESSKKYLSPLWSRFRALALFSLGISAFALVVSGRFPNTDYDRYVPEFVFIPLIWVAVWGIPILPLSTRQARALAVLGILCFALTTGFYPSDTRVNDYPNLTRCLDQHAKDLPTPWGFSDFYAGKLVTFTNREQLLVNQLNTHFAPYLWQNSASWFEEDLYGRPITKHSFFIALGKARVAAATDQWGPPERSFTCRYAGNDYLVMLYPDGISAKRE